MAFLSARDRYIEIGILVISATLLLFVLSDRLGAETAAPWDYGLVPLLTGMMLASASQLVRGNRARWSLRVVSFVLLGVALAILFR
ncbi:MAG: hypothetical protein IT357_16180 [Gemmatimonadaceae bacterium]|nr:hypothetical protein [Gemmatimonadaceae bacterium]